MCKKHSIFKFKKFISQEIMYSFSYGTMKIHFDWKMSLMYSIKETSIKSVFFMQNILQILSEL